MKPMRNLWLAGMVYGFAFWGLSAFLGLFLLEAIEKWQPKWMGQLDVIDTLGTVFAVAAAPIGIGGWLWIWGDNGPPYPWIDSWAFTVAFGLIFYGLAGSATALLTSRQRTSIRFGVRALLILTTLVAVLLGLVCYSVR